MQTSEQQLAIQADLLANVQIIAGAGTGKTFTLASRVVRHINARICNEENIFAISFTNAASGELRKRIETLLGRSSTLKATNLHKLCSRFLRLISIKFSGYEQVPSSSFQILTSSSSKDTFSILYDAACADAFTRFDESTIGICLSPSELARELSRMKAEGVDVNSDLALDYGNINQASLYVMRAYDHYCRQNNLLDFDDLIVRLKEILTKHAEIKSWVNNQVQGFYVDEFQDISSSQMELISLIRGSTAICVVGDACQSIYGFRGANPEHFNNFATELDNAKVFALTYNFRSHSGLLDISNIVRRKMNSNDFGLRSVSSSILPRTLSYKLESSEANVIASQIQALKSSGYSLDDIAILYRSNSKSVALMKALVSMGINVKTNGHSEFWDRRVIKQALAIFSLIENGRNLPALKTLLPAIHNAGKSALTYVAEHIKNNSQSDCRAALCLVNPSAGAHLDMMLSTVESIVAEHGFIPAFERLAQDNYFSINEGLFDESRELLESLAGFVEKSKVSNFEELNELIALSDAKNTSKKDAVTLSTIHSAKGNEFKVVFIAGVNNGQIPHPRATGDGLQEEARILYVALTRAKELLYVCHQEGNLSSLVRPYSDLFHEWTDSAPQGRFSEEYIATVTKTRNELLEMGDRRTFEINDMLLDNELEGIKEKMSLLHAQRGTKNKPKRKANKLAIPEYKTVRQDKGASISAFDPSF